MQSSIHSSPDNVRHFHQYKPLCRAAFRVLSCSCGEAEDAPPQAPQWHLLHSQLRHLADRLVRACRFPSLPCIDKTCPCHVSTKLLYRPILAMKTKAAVPSYSCHCFNTAAVPSCPCCLLTQLLYHLVLAVLLPMLLCCPVHTDHLLGFNPKS